MPAKYWEHPIAWEDKVITDKGKVDYERKLQWLKSFWKKIGMTREPTIEDVKNPTTREEETARMLRMVFPNEK